MLSSAAAIALVSLSKIWSEAPHSAFGDLVRFRQQWVCVFREANGHVAAKGREDDGRLRVITSSDGQRWTPAALIAEAGVDLRDPHLSVTPDDRLMITAGGSEYPGGVFQGRHSRVLFSKDARQWTAPAKVLERGEWLWRVTWSGKTAYGVAKRGNPPDSPRRTRLVKSEDGLAWQPVVDLEIPGGDETTIRFDRHGRMIAFMRRVSDDGDKAMIGVSAAPYRDWQWTRSGHFVGGPNFIVLGDGRLLGGGRVFENGDPKKPRTQIGFLNETSFTPSLTLESSGDNSYPAFVEHQGAVWTMYYSSHEGKAQIYLARLNPGK